MTGRFIKPVNALSAGLKYIKSIMTGKVFVSAMPVALSIELTNNCNLQCPECPSGSGLMKRRRGYMDKELFSRIISELKPYLFNLNLYFQGESMLHPRFFSFLANNPDIPVTLSTNGHFLSEENSEKLVRSNLSKLVISLDGLDQDTYSKYRKEGNVDTVIKGINNVINAKERYGSHLKPELQFLVHRYNEHQIRDIKRFAGKHKLVLNFKSMQISDKSHIEFWLPLSRRFRRYEKTNGEYIIRNSMPDRCARLWFNPVITWDGKVLPCCFDKDADHVMGDLNRDSFRDVWNSTKYGVFRKNVLHARNTIDICRNCTSGMSIRIKY